MDDYIALIKISVRVGSSFITSSLNDDKFTCVKKRHTELITKFLFTCNIAITVHTSVMQYEPCSKSACIL